MDPPQTPWVGLPPFQDEDESPLMNAQPIFEDSFSTTKGDGDGLDDWVENIPGNVRRTRRNVVGKSGDLEDYPPQEEKFTQQSIVVQKQTSTREDGEILGQENTRAMTAINNRQTSHKRVGSQSLIPIARPSKKAKPPIPKEKIDSLYTRRLSDSIQRNPTNNIENLHACLTSTPFQSHIPQAHTSSLNLHKNKMQETSKSRSKASLHVPPVLNGKEEVRGFGADGQIQKHTSFRRIPQMQEKTSSRGLTESNDTQPSRQNTIETSSASGNIPRRDGSANQDGVQTLANQVATQHLLSVIDHEKFTAHRQPSPFSLASTTSEISSSHTHTSEIQNSSSGSRRSSMSEKVVGFLSNLLTRSISSSLPRDELSSSISEKQVEGEEDDATVPLRYDIDQDEDIAVVFDNEYQEGQEAREHCLELNPEKRLPLNKAEISTNRVSAKHFYSIVPLTTPILCSRPLHIRPETNARAQSISMIHPKFKPLQPSRSANTNISSSSSNSSKASTSIDEQPSVITSTGARSTINRPITKSVFTSEALAKLPPPGKGHSTSLSTQPVIVKSTERVRDLKERKSVFERSSEPNPNPNSINKKQRAHPRPSRAGMNLTVPIRGHTPGKASDIRSKQRAKLDAIVHEKIKEKEKQQEELKKRKEQEEEEVYLRKRKETVIWAKPVPDMYKR
ncbi:hypothetical protein L486_00811 [Kwoniella mangroviensis CBS 10435]|uniref:TPX2 C-terminal domain-containing protein n=1 Tax=Kwoniella mangroviensis CBS 10435 TaxID=1331196 RepID=A0A1B9J056_9TREE|nr:hypothetical protein L486_00811 [Kwoniella mangroviensis CBS 10435]